MVRGCLLGTWLGAVYCVRGYGLFTGIGFCTAVTDRRKCELWKSGSPSDALLFSLSGVSLAKHLFNRVSYLRIGKFISCGFFFEKLDNFWSCGLLQRSMP